MRNSATLKVEAAHHIYIYMCIYEIERRNVSQMAKQPNKLIFASYWRMRQK
jgi:hypothetical protein